MSIDGKVASPTGQQIKISCNEDLKRMYRLRNTSDAILVGVGTVLSDDPKLTVKDKYIKNPKQPIRIVLDTNCRTPKNAEVVNDTAKTIIVVGYDCNKKFGNNVEIIKCKITKENLINLKCFLEILYKRGVKKLMVEGGSTVISNFLKEDLVDDFYIYVSPIIIGGKNTPALVNKDCKKINLKLVKIKNIGSGILLHYRLVK
jgi:2,5-diamino-6-(ribosylamino)-4(3H)-pyrimidinone 5'-phosphate reductase